jgi:hypothetical protein
MVDLTNKLGNAEVVSRPWIVFEDKASMRFKCGAYTEYVSIVNRIVMHLSIIKLMQIPLRGNAVIGQ